MTANPLTLHRYNGKGAAPAKPNPGAWNIPEPYIPTETMQEAVNLALLLQRPVLLEGEAGSGKSRLARAVAYELGWPLREWSVRSTSKAEDGLYKFDALRRLYDVEMLRAGLSSNKIPRNPENPADYRELRQLGEAFQSETGPFVVLIDEIDKADLDFPNDLLNVLDDPWSFDIPETGENISAKHKPLVLITSNKEKGQLPSPFLRRCIYCYVRFPNSVDELRKIVDLHATKISKNGDLDENLVQNALDLFINVRASKLFKKPGTSELIDWLTALHRYNDDVPYAANDLAKDKSLPYPETLFKLQADLPIRQPNI